MARPNKIIKELNMKEEFSAPKTNLEDKMKWCKTWNGEILVRGNVYKVGNEFCVYAGDFKSKDEVPKLFCCYTIGDDLKVRHPILNTQQELPLRERKRRTEDDRPIDTTSKDTDNNLMVLIKSALQFKNVTRGDFRRLYPNVSDMNNILRCIEKGENLSWTRFTDLAEKLNLDYDLSIFADGQIITKI